MCGIIGIVGGTDVAPILLDGLRRLEYRGYDSAGIATLVDGRIDRRRAEGKLRNLAARLGKEPLGGTIGIGHTRWATHGRPTENNAHPHATERVAVVHNGIIENYQALQGPSWRRSRPHLRYRDGHRGGRPPDHPLHERARRPPEEAARARTQAVAGRLRPRDRLRRRGRPDGRRPPGIVAGRRLWPRTRCILGSDAMALAPLTSRICYLEEGDSVAVTRSGAVVRDADGRIVERRIHSTGLSRCPDRQGRLSALHAKGDPRAADGHRRHAEEVRRPGQTRSIVLPDLPFDLAEVTRLSLIACGTAHYAGQVAKYWFESIARLPVEVDVASEFRYRERAPCGGRGRHLHLAVGARRHRHARRPPPLQGAAGQHCIGRHGQRAGKRHCPREQRRLLPTLAGPEIGVASTKAFTTQLTVLACLADRHGPGARRHRRRARSGPGGRPH